MKRQPYAILALAGGRRSGVIGVGRQHLAVGVVQTSEFHRGLGLKRMEELLGRGNVAETQDAGAVERQHSGLGLQGLHLEAAHGADLVQGHPPVDDTTSAIPTATTDNKISFVLIDQSRRTTHLSAPCKLNRTRT